MKTTAASEADTVQRRQPVAEQEQTAQAHRLADAVLDASPRQAAQRQVIQRITGLPPDLQRGMEAMSGMDLSDVNVHRNSSKPAAMNAHAYAQGNDIHLAPGQEQHLPHEAWHVVQQRQGRVQPTMQLEGVAVNDDAMLEAEADAMGSRALQMKVAEPLPTLQGFGRSTAVQFKRVETMGGTFEDDDYRATSGGSSRGCEIGITFTPRDPVDATKIGMSQALRSIRGGGIYSSGNNPTTLSRTIPLGQEGGGTRIDRLHTKTNPLYGMLDSPNLEGSVSMGQGHARLGKHHRGLGNVLEHADAYLHDSPKMNSGTTPAEKIFETTALAVGGAQAGTYYGSVRWGWRTDNTGAISLEDFSVVSYGVPSSSFMAAARLWATKTSSGGSNLLPLPTSTVPVRFVVAFRTKPGQAVCVVGSAPELGAWNSDHAVPMHYQDGEHWYADVQLNSNMQNSVLDYKYLLKDGDKTRWEEGGNHHRTTGAVDTPHTFDDKWYGA